MSASEVKTVYRPVGFCFWQRGQKYAEGAMAHGKKDGKWVFWYQSGQKQMEGEYCNNKRNGRWVKWHENGQKQIEGEFINGKMHGRWTCWYSSGQKQMEGSWVYGKRDGEWTYWKENAHTDFPVIDKVDMHDYKMEKEHENIMLTDLELKRMISKRFREIRQREWERMVGRSIGRVVKRWHVLFFIIVVIPAYALMKPHLEGKALPIAVGATLIVTLILEIFSRLRDGHH
jgi:hypothetical protein